MTGTTEHLSTLGPMQNRQLSMAVELHQKGELDKALAAYIEMLDSQIRR